MERVEFHGWKNNARLVCNDIEMIVTLEVGPRVLGYGFIGWPNELHVSAKTAGQSGGSKFYSYGGHRLWIAPEEHPRTFQPDNGPVGYKQDGDWHVFSASPDTFHTQKEIRIQVDEGLERFVLEHRVYNLSGYALRLASWTPTQFAPGGTCVFPQAPYISHQEKVLPGRPLVLWNYCDMSDPRYTWGKKVVRLQWQDAPPTKIGARVEQGYAAYANHGNLYLRRFEFIPDASYPDFGCNFETFTRHDMLEVESLGPMIEVAPGGFASHREAWYLLRGVSLPADDSECHDLLERVVAERPL